TNHTADSAWSQETSRKLTMSPVTGKIVSMSSGVGVMTLPGWPSAGPRAPSGTDTAGQASTPLPGALGYARSRPEWEVTDDHGPASRGAVLPRYRGVARLVRACRLHLPTRLRRHALVRARSGRGDASPRRQGHATWRAGAARRRERRQGRVRACTRTRTRARGPSGVLRAAYRAGSTAVGGRGVRTPRPRRPVVGVHATTLRGSPVRGRQQRH